METKAIGILLIILGILLGLIMFDGIGIACPIGVLSSLLNGINFTSIPLNKQLKEKAK